MIKALARMCLSGIFIIAGYGAFSKPGGRPNALPKIGLPASEELVKVNGATMVGAGVMLGLGIFPRFSALTLIGALIPTTLAGHPFWKETEENPRQTHQIQFLKNLGLIGGLLLVLADRKKKQDA